MSGFENTHLWESTLAELSGDDPHKKEREFLRSQFYNFRKNASVLAGEISRDLPNFTVHDITHLDALWEMASLICGKDYELNPAEAFVLGGAFLLHDLGMGLAAYPEGVEDLKKGDLWQDTESSLKKRYALNSSKNSSLEIEEKIKKETTEIVLRGLHAKHAEKLALISWNDKDLSKQYFLLENSELRESYGKILGVLAHSHWWDVLDLLEKLPGTLGAPGDLPNEWCIDTLKLACILRAADVAHLDSRRAPSFLKAIRRPDGFSNLHWVFQQKLFQPRLENERLVFTSKEDFSSKEAKSWWLCFDALKAVDEELRKIDSLLVSENKPGFKAKGVAGINDVSHISKLIGIDGWYPVDTKIHVSNVAKLVKNLGGKELYGENLLVPLRELIQNASDAIRARRILESETSEWGEILVKTGSDKNGRFVEVQDNGVGMSVNVLQGPFLDFGTSFWGTSMMHNELPGLESQGFHSTGHYGIGFFSTFIWGEKISVTTRRYEDSRGETKVLEFQKGLNERPLLREARPSEFLKDGGTKVKVWFSDEGIYNKILNCAEGNKQWELSQIIEHLCPCIDTNLKIEEKSKKRTIIKANDWKTIPPKRLIKRIIGELGYKRALKEQKQVVDKIAKNMSDMYEGGELVGRCSLYANMWNLEMENNIWGVVTVGGFRSCKTINIIGVLNGRANRASRDIGIPLVSKKVLADWVNRQNLLISSISKKEEEIIEHAAVIRALGQKPEGVVIARARKGFVSIKEIKEIILNRKLKEIILVQDAAVKIHERKTKRKLKLDENVFSVKVGRPSFIQLERGYPYLSWPDNNSEWFDSGTLCGLLVETAAEVWGVGLEEVKECSSFDNDEKNVKHRIGTTKGKIIKKSVNIIRCPKK